MGNVSMTIHAVGSHHDDDNPHDLNKMFVRIVDEVKAKGHAVTHAHFHHGAAEDMLDEKTATRAGLYGPLALAATTGLALLAAVLMTGTGPAIAADLPAKKVAATSPFQYPVGSGWYVGIGSEGGGGSANVTAPGINSASLMTTSIDVHGLVGYVWAVPNTSMFADVEVRGGWTNFNGETAGFSFSGPAAFEQRFAVGAPTDQILAMFGNLFGGLTPPPFTPPAGQAITWTKGYIGVTLDERDISLNYALTSNKVWAIAPGLTIGAKNLLSGGTLIDVYAKVRFDDKGMCVGAPVTGCGSVGTTFLAGVNLDWGI